MTDQELWSIQWRNPEYIAFYGGLRSENVLDYFSLSPFYDRRSNNQVLKMQSQLLSLGDVKENLRKMRGIEFEIAYERPPDLWIIRKQQRLSPDEGVVSKSRLGARG